MTDDTIWTHKAYGKQRLGKTHHVWLEIGEGRMGEDGVFHGSLNRTIIGGFNGYVYFAPKGTEPPEVRPQPEQPRRSFEDEA